MYDIYQSTPGLRGLVVSAPDSELYGREIESIGVIRSSSYYPYT